jgi:transcriptional regulator with XRE-family HTH domain
MGLENYLGLSYVLQYSQGWRTDMTQASDFSVYKHVGARLRSLRQGRGLTQAQVASLVGVSPQQYQKYEDAQTKCSLAALLTLAGYYGVPVETIIYAEGLAASEARPSLADLLKMDIDTATIDSAEQELLARLVTAYLHIPDSFEKERLVELMEAVRSAHAA